MAAGKVGFFHNGRAESFQAHFDAFLRGLHGLVDKNNVEVISKWAGGETKSKALEGPIAQLRDGGVNVIVAAGGPPSAVAARTVTRDKQVPVVFMSVADPVDLGLVKSLERSETNMIGIAGLTSELDGARLQLLSEFLGVGRPATIGVLNNKNRPHLDKQFQALAAVAAKSNLSLVRKDVESSDEIVAAFDFFKAGTDGVLVTADSFFNDFRKQVVSAARGLPAIYQWREFVEEGGLMSFGPNVMEAYTKVGEYAGQILNGRAPQDMPVAFPERLELVLNLRVAYADGFNIPASLLSRAQLVRDPVLP